MLPQRFVGLKAPVAVERSFFRFFFAAPERCFLPRLFLVAMAMAPSSKSVSTSLPSPSDGGGLEATELGKSRRLPPRSPLADSPSSLELVWGSGRHRRVRALLTHGKRHAKKR